MWLFLIHRKSPFQLIKRGWGEFPVHVQIHFKDSRNKRLDVVHDLKLDWTLTGLQTFGGETIRNVDLVLQNSTSDNLITTYDDNTTVVNQNQQQSNELNLIQNENSNSNDINNDGLKTLQEFTIDEQQQQQSHQINDQQNIEFPVNHESIEFNSTISNSSNSNSCFDMLLVENQNFKDISEQQHSIKSSNANTVTLNTQQHVQQQTNNQQGQSQNNKSSIDDLLNLR
jgi:transcription initiation factor IIF auxiliary subunit